MQNASIKKAILWGVCIEAILFGLMYSQDFGPCGPATSLGFVLMLLHWPGMFLLSPLANINLPEWTGMAIMFISSALLWSLLVYAFLRTRDAH